VSRKVKIPLYILLGLAGLAVALTLVMVLVIRTDWFRDKLRERMIAELEEATGGRVEAGALNLEWRTLTAEVPNLVIHGAEPATEAPLFRADSIQVGLRIVSLWKKEIDIASLLVNRPQVNLIVYADGRTNMPQPRAARRARKNTVETVLDLAIRRFQIAEGTIRVASKQTPLNVLGENLRVRIAYEAGPPRYRGEVSFRKLNVAPGKRPVLPIDVDAALLLAADRLEIARAHFTMKDSSMDVKGALHNFAAPRTELEYSLQVQVKDIGPDLKVSQIANKGSVTVAGRAVITGASDLLVTGKVQGRGLEFQERGIRIPNIGLTSTVRITPERIELAGLTLSALGGRFSGRGVMTRWRRFQVEGQIENYSVQQLTSGIEDVGQVVWNGNFSGPAGVTGELLDGDLRDVIARGRMTVSPAKGENPVEGLIDLTYDQNAASIDLGESSLSTRYSRAEVSGTLGKTLEVTLQSTDLDDLRPAILLIAKGPPPALPVKLLPSGAARFQGTVSGPLKNPTVQGRVSISRFVFEGHTIAQAEASVVVRDSGVSVKNAIVTKDQMRAAGSLEVGFQDWEPDPSQPVSGAFTVRTASLPALLAEFEETLPVTGGPASADVKVAGSVGAPWASGSVQVSKLVAWGQPLDSVRGQVRYTETSVEVTSGQIQAGPGRLDVSGVFEHPKGDAKQGRLRLRVASGGIQLAKVQQVAERLPGLGGRLETQMSGEIAVAPSGLRPGVFDGWVAVRDLANEGNRLGWLKLTASGKEKTLSTRLEGELAGSKVAGEAQWALDGSDVRGHVECTALKFSQLLAHLGTSASRAAPFEGLVAGKADFSGPSLDPNTWKAVVELPVFEIRPAAGAIEAANPKELVLRNEGPILVDLDARGARVRQALLRGKNADLTISGSVGFGGKNPWDLRVRAGANLALLQDLDDRFSSSGAVALDVSVRGSTARPDVYGRIELKNASVNLAGLPNGIENANGLIFLFRDRAMIDNLTAGSGGGKVAFSGFVGFAGVTSFQLQAKATDVRMRYPEGVSSSMNANLSFTGTTDHSLLAGDIVVTRMGFNPRSDLGSILARTAQPVRAPGRATRFERGMHLDVHIVTSSQARLETQLTRDIQADADLRLRGDPIRPVLLGRVLINQGEVLFFGSRYTIGSGQLLFVNASKIEPIVNLDLETTARGVEVTLHIAGPVEKMNVSYRSDPPLSFPDIVGLLTTGSEPATSRGLGGQQSQFSQSWGQAGPGALLSQAIANPIAGRLQRFFGVSRLKIDPQVTGVTTSNAAARVTVEQQISSNLSFTYITDLSRAQAQTIRVEWDLNKDWSAVALREESGLFGIDFLYKKQFK
jgi:translocation and assembly module TamB